MNVTPITLDSLITYQEKRLQKAKDHENETVVYAEKVILEIIKEHNSLVVHENEMIHVTMSPERFKKIENIR